MMFLISEVVVCFVGRHIGNMLSSATSMRRWWGLLDKFEFCEKLSLRSAENRLALSILEDTKEWSGLHKGGVLFFF